MREDAFEIATTAARPIASRLTTRSRSVVGQRQSLGVIGERVEDSRADVGSGEGSQDRNDSGQPLDPELLAGGRGALRDAVGGEQENPAGRDLGPPDAVSPLEDTPSTRSDSEAIGNHPE